MSIRIGTAEFSKHEFVLLIVCLLFFGMLFFGSFKFETFGKVFPLLVGGPGFFMVLLYLFSGLISPRLHETMKKGTDFRLFGLLPEEDQLPGGEETLPGASEDGTGDRPRKSFTIQASYLVLGLFAGFVLTSYLFGFYLSTLLFAGSYLFLFFKDGGRGGAVSMIGKVVLLALLLGAVAVFDYSFGHNFMEGAVYELLGWM